MIIKTHVVILLILMSLGYSSNANAWGQIGHRVSGQIAELYLTEDAKKAIASILNNESLAEISTLPDENLSNPSEFWRKTSVPYHWVTVPENKTYTQVGAPEEGDSYTAIKKFTLMLKDKNTSREDKRIALMMVVHFIGDLHQPLHAGNGTDRGGNLRKVNFFWEESNLHRVWDSGMIDRKKLSYTEWTQFLAPKITKEQVQAWHTTDPLVYIKESTEIRDTIYPTDDNLTWQYLYDHIPTVKLRLQQAGVRIAAHLNAVFEK